MTGFTSVSWLPPWSPCDPGLENELAREVGRGHPLAGVKAVAVARRVDTDDVLFHLPDGPAPLAVVRLTWTGRRETSPDWPWTEFFASLEEWIERMKQDHADPDVNR